MKYIEIFKHDMNKEPVWEIPPDAINTEIDIAYMDYSTGGINLNNQSPALKIALDMQEQGLITQEQFDEFEKELDSRT